MVCRFGFVYDVEVVQSVSIYANLQYRWICVCSFGLEFSAVFSSIGAKCTSHHVVFVGWQHSHRSPFSFTSS